jgi:hypothetical protein
MLTKFIKPLIHFSLVFLSSLIFAKFRKAYLSAKGETLPVILVAGNVGKSSQTLFLNQAFEHLGYKVWTGTTQNKNRNTLTGLIMTLGELDISLEGANGLQKLSFLIRAKLIWLFKSWNFGQKPNILIFEIGVDHQDEMNDYIQVFKKVDWVVLSNFGPEHTAGFSKNFNPDKTTISSLQDLFELFPELDIEKQNLDNLLKNCYFEQLKLLQIGKNYILPASFDLQKNEIAVKSKSKLEAIKPKISRNNSSVLLVNEIATPDCFLLPLSFSKQISMTQKVGELFGLTRSAFAEVTANMILPNGRFGFFEGVNQTKIIDSSYNSDPASLNSFLDLILEIKSSEKQYIVLGEMRELGEVAVSVHNEILERLESISQQLNAEVLLLGATWLHCRYDRQKFKHFKTVGDIVRYFKQDIPKADSWIWIKGSQNTIFLEVLVESLLSKNSDKSKLARQGSDWDELRQSYL